MEYIGSKSDLFLYLIPYFKNILLKYIFGFRFAEILYSYPVIGAGE